MPMVPRRSEGGTWWLRSRGHPAPPAGALGGHGSVDPLGIRCRRQRLGRKAGRAQRERGSQVHSRHQWWGPLGHRLAEGASGCVGARGWGSGCSGEGIVLQGCGSAQGHFWEFPKKPTLDPFSFLTCGTASLVLELNASPLRSFLPVNACWHWKGDRP